MTTHSNLKRLAMRRNSSKWRLTGLLSQLRGLASASDTGIILTPAERMQLGPAIVALEEIHNNWNKSNLEVGLKNPDAKEEE